MRAAAVAVFAGLLGIGVAVAAACTDESGQPLGQGDNVTVNGADASTSSGSDDAGKDYDAAVFAPPDALYAPAPDGYAPFAWCSQCGCPAGTFCFGGGTGYEQFSGDCHADAGPIDGGAGLAIGCYPFPGGCAVEPSCECLIMAMSQYVSCYPVCSITKNIVYCPNP